MEKHKSKIETYKVKNNYERFIKDSYQHMISRTTSRINNAEPTIKFLKNKKKSESDRPMSKNTKRRQIINIISERKEAREELPFMSVKKLTKLKEFRTDDIRDERREEEKNTIRMESKSQLVSDRSHLILSSRR